MNLQENEYYCKLVNVPRSKINVNNVLPTVE